MHDRFLCPLLEGEPTRVKPLEPPLEPLARHYPRVDVWERQEDVEPSHRHHSFKEPVEDPIEEVKETPLPGKPPPNEEVPHVLKELRERPFVVLP